MTPNRTGNQLCRRSEGKRWRVIGSEINGYLPVITEAGGNTYLRYIRKETYRDAVRWPMIPLYREARA